MSLRGAFLATTLAPHVICLANHAGEQSPFRWSNAPDKIQPIRWGLLRRATPFSQ